MQQAQEVFLSPCNNYFGLCKDDIPLTSKTTASWKPSVSSEVDNNYRRTKCLRAREEEESFE